MTDPLASLSLVGNVGTLRIEAGDPQGHHALVCWNGQKQTHEWVISRTGKTGWPFVTMGQADTLWGAVQAAVRALPGQMPLFPKETADASE